MKIKKLLSILFSIPALLIMTTYAGENRSANDNSFAGFDVYTFSAGDKDATYYLNENTLHIQERSLGSRYNSYDQTITFSTVEKNGVPYIRYTESDRQYISLDGKKFEVKKSDGTEREAVFFKNRYFRPFTSKEYSRTKYKKNYTEAAGLYGTNVRIFDRQYSNSYNSIRYYYESEYTWKGLGVSYRQ